MSMLRTVLLVLQPHAVVQPHSVRLHFRHGHKEALGYLSGRSLATPILGLTQIYVDDFFEASGARARFAAALTANALAVADDQRGVRPPGLGGVELPQPWEVESVASMDTHLCVRASDEALERWVAKPLLIEESNTGIPVPEGLTVLAYLINNAAQWGRRMTRKGSLNSAFAFYLSVYMYDACRLAVEDGYLVPLYGPSASREDVVMSVVQAERRHHRDSLSVRTGGGSITAPIEYAEAYIYTDQNKVDMVPDPPSGKRHKRAATPRSDHHSASM